MNVSKKLDQLEAELAEEGLNVKLLIDPEGVVVVGKYVDRCLARQSLKNKGVVCKRIEPEEP